MQGVGGIEKTVLAAALAHGSEVRQTFPDGICWLITGQKANRLDLQNPGNITRRAHHQFT